MQPRPAPIALVLLLSCAGPAAGLADDGRPGDSFLDNGVTAHRGDSSRSPENTLAAFRSAIEAGADWVELDIFRTKDGHLVVAHDRTTGRVGDADLVVPESTLEQLRGIDVAEGFRRARGQTLAGCPPERIPTLEEALRLIMAQGRTRVSIQPKMDCVADAVALVQKLGAERWVGFNDGDLALMSEAKRLAPEIPVFWDRGNTDIDEDIRIAKGRGFEALVLREGGITAEEVAKIKAAGLTPGAWTVNDAGAMARLLEMGIERIYTDRPRDLLALKCAMRAGAASCEGAYPKHLQGICTDDRGALFWSFTDALVKTDLAGRKIAKVPVADHHGDPCHRDGRIYVAVNLGAFNQPAGRADSWVYVYDAATLAEVARHRIPEVVHGAGGIAHRDGRFYVVGGLPPGSSSNLVYEYDEAFAFRKRHELGGGYTLMGIQTIAFADGHWWLGCYGEPEVMLKAGPDFKLVGRWEFDASLGIVGLADGRLLVARGSRDGARGFAGRVIPAFADEARGLRLAEPADPRDWTAPLRPCGASSAPPGSTPPPRPPPATTTRAPGQSPPC